MQVRSGTRNIEVFNLGKTYVGADLCAYVCYDANASKYGDGLEVVIVIFRPASLCQSWPRRRSVPLGLRKQICCHWVLATNIFNPRSYIPTPNRMAKGAWASRANRIIYGGVKRRDMLNLQFVKEEFDLNVFIKRTQTIYQTISYMKYWTNSTVLCIIHERYLSNKLCPTNSTICKIDFSLYHFLKAALYIFIKKRGRIAFKTQT